MYKRQVGQFVDGTFFFTAQAAQNEAVFSIGPRDLIIDLPFRIQGLVDNGCAAVYSTKRPWFRFVPVMDGAAYFQEPILPENDLWVGNIFVCDDPSVKFTVVVDGQAPGKPPFMEVHNPTGKIIETRIWSPPHTPFFGGISAAVKLPAGDSLFFTINGKQLVPK